MPTQKPLTADEFIAGIDGFETLPIGKQVDLLAYYALNHAGHSSVTAATLASLREALHLGPHRRLRPYLSEQSVTRTGKRASYVRASGGGYVLERGYSKAIATEYLGRPATKNLAVNLRGTVSAIGDPAVKSYLEEAIGCFEHGLLRSSIILSWCVAYGLCRAWLFRNHLPGLNAEMAKWKTPVQVTKLDDFEELKEAVVLETARKADAITKTQHKLLKQLLDDRNSYAHPTTKSITPSMAEAYIEKILHDVFPHFG